MLLWLTREKLRGLTAPACARETLCLALSARQCQTDWVFKSLSGPGRIENKLHVSTLDVLDNLRHL